MKNSELRDKNKADLVKMNKDTARELMDARFKLATGQLKDTTKLSKYKRDIARINTILREKQ